MNDDNTTSGYSHDVMEQIKITLTIDGDLAATLTNLVGYAADEDMLDDLIFCGHTYPKLEAFMELLNKELDIEHREEK